MLEQQQLGRSGPLQVVEDEHDRAVLRGRGDQAGDRLEHQITLGLRLRRLRSGKRGHPLRQLGSDPQQLALVLAHMMDEHIVGSVQHVVAQRLDERPVGMADVLVAGAEQDDGAFAECDPRGLRRQPGLADAGLAAQQDDLSLSPLGGGPAPRDHRLLGGTPIEPERRTAGILGGNGIVPSGASRGSHSTATPRPAREDL